MLTVGGAVPSAPVGLFCTASNQAPKNGSEDEYPDADLDDLDDIDRPGKGKRARRTRQRPGADGGQHEQAEHGNPDCTKPKNPAPLKAIHAPNAIRAGLFASPEDPSSLSREGFFASPSGGGAEHSEAEGVKQRSRSTK